MAIALLGFGLAALAGGLLREKQAFTREQAGLLPSPLILTVIALLLPAVFGLSGRTLTGGRGLAVSDEQLSLGMSVVLLLYGGNLVWMVITHCSVFTSGGEGKSSWFEG